MMFFKKIKKIFKDNRAISDMPVILAVTLTLAIFIMFGISTAGAVADGRTIGDSADNISKIIQYNGQINNDSLISFKDSTKNLRMTDLILKIKVDDNTFTYTSDITSITPINIQLGKEFTVTIKGNTYIGVSSSNESNLKTPISGKGRGVSEVFWK